MNIKIRPENNQDIDDIFQLTQAAFENIPLSSKTEQFIINELRVRGELSISLVATTDKEVIGHLAVTPVTLSTGEKNWYEIGPISVHPAYQKRGIGSKLINAALQQLRAEEAQGCVVLGDPSFYQKFGFKSYPNFYLPDVPIGYFQAISFTSIIPTASVKYSPAFTATE